MHCKLSICAMWEHSEYRYFNVLISYTVKESVRLSVPHIAQKLIVRLTSDLVGVLLVTQSCAFFLNFCCSLDARNFLY